MKRIVVVGFFCLVLLAAAASGDPRRGLVLTDLGGEKVYVDSLLVTGPVVLNFWATWCRPCRIEMPHLQRIYTELEPAGVHFAAVSLDQAKHIPKVKEYVSKQKISIPVYHDTDYALAKLFRVMGIPTTVLLDQDGEVHHRTRGYRPGDEVILQKKIEALVKKAEAAAEEPSEEEEG
jgi:thiol-disulfide isomerase/thioredoxin